MAARLTLAEKGAFLALAVLAVATAVLLAELATVRPGPPTEMECNRPIRTESATIAISTVNPAASYYVLLPAPVALPLGGEVHNSTRLARSISITAGEATFRTLEWDGVFLFAIVAKGNVSMGAEVKFDECDERSFGEEAQVFSSDARLSNARFVEVGVSVRAFLATMDEALDAIHVSMVLSWVSLWTCSGNDRFEGDLTVRGQWNPVYGGSRHVCI